MRGEKSALEVLAAARATAEQMEQAALYRQQVERQEQMERQQGLVDQADQVRRRPPTHRSDCLPVKRHDQIYLLAQPLSM